MAAKFEAGSEVCTGTIEESAIDLIDKKKLDYHRGSTSIIRKNYKKSQEEYL